jgi:hypothetical protein
MVAEWEAVVPKFTEGPPHLHYGTSSHRRASHRATYHGEQCRIAVILTMETIHQQLNH